MNRPSISIIVPIYQSETTLRRCLDSILSQTLGNVEVLLVNDGSTDKSAEICDEYAKNDSRIRMFHKVHSGVSDARQLGLENAVGEYVIHCDSDDWMEPNMLEVLFAKAKETNADMVVCDYYRESSSSQTIHREFPKGLDSNKPIAKQIKALSYCTWNKLVRRSLFEKYGISFPKGALMAEDVYVTMLLLNSNIHVEYVSQCLYHYDHICNCHNLTNNLTREAVESNIQVINNLDKVLDKSFHCKLNTNKKKVVIDAYRNHLLNKKELKQLYPEVRCSLFFTALKEWSLIPLVI